tara:strand:+ start:353 stop:1147 length:795 start_codon:yes stop_codon:yes gene_type:complete
MGIIKQMINIINENKESNYLIICDHASNFIPKEFDNLGLDKGVLDTHVAYDIGAKEVALNLSNLIKCPLIISNFSRLLIDVNRGIDDPTLIMKISDGNIINGNKNLSFFNESDDREERINNYYNHYHKKISDLIKKSTQKNIYPAIISIHSFTPFWGNKKRQTELGILWDKDYRLPNIFFKYFADQTQFNIGNNDPYVGYLKNDSLYKHATLQGLPNILLEFRQDLISDQDRQKKMAQIISEVLINNINNTWLFKRVFFGSRTD